MKLLQNKVNIPPVRIGINELCKEMLRTVKGAEQ